MLLLFPPLRPLVFNAKAVGVSFLNITSLILLIIAKSVLNTSL